MSTGGCINNCSLDDHCLLLVQSMNNQRHNPREMPTDLTWKLIEDITNGFAVERKISSGGYAAVYKVWSMILLPTFSVSTNK